MPKKTKSKWFTVHITRITTDYGTIRVKAKNEKAAERIAEASVIDDVGDAEFSESITECFAVLPQRRRKNIQQPVDVPPA